MLRATFTSYSLVMLKLNVFRAINFTRTFTTLWLVAKSEGPGVAQWLKVKAICGSYSTAALRHILLLPE